jgi:hypothetical protein
VDNFNQFRAIMPYNNYGIDEDDYEETTIKLGE